DRATPGEDDHSRSPMRTRGGRAAVPASRQPLAASFRNYDRLSREVVVRPPIEAPEEFERREAGAGEQVLQLVSEEPTHPRLHGVALRGRARPAALVTEGHVHDLGG